MVAGTVRDVCERLGTPSDVGAAGGTTGAGTAYWWRDQLARCNRFDDRDWVILKLNLRDLGGIRTTRDIWSATGVIIDNAGSIPRGFIEVVGEQVAPPIPPTVVGFTLTVEGHPPVQSPTAEQIAAAVDELTRYGGPGFLILDGPGGDFAQIAGGDGAFTVEWREYSGREFRHFVAGHPGRAAKHFIAIPTNGFHVTVQENERLNPDDVKMILTAFLERRPRPTDFAWRDVSDRFV